MISKRFLFLVVFWWCLLVFLSFFLVRWSNGNHRRQEEGRYYISSSVSFLRAREKTPTLSTTRGLIHLETTVTCWNIYSFGRKHGGREERQVSVDHRGAFKSSFFLLLALSLYNRRSFCVWKDWTNFCNIIRALVRRRAKWVSPNEFHSRADERFRRDIFERDVDFVARKRPVSRAWNSHAGERNCFKIFLLFGLIVFVIFSRVSFFEKKERKKIMTNTKNELFYYPLYQQHRRTRYCANKSND